MKFMIEDKEYNAEEGVSKVTLSTLYELKVKTGIGMKTLAEMVQRFDQITDPLDLLENKDSFKAFMIVIWLARRHAGERLSLEEASGFPLDTFRIVMEDDDEQPEQADPKAQPDSGPDAAPAPEPVAPTT